MRILDEQNQELSQEDVDLSLGYLKDEKLFIKKEPMKAHYKVNCFVFTDGTSYTPESENDPHIRIVDADEGRFEYIPDEGDERTVRGAAIGLVVDKEPEDIYEDIKRYIHYRTDELELHELPSRIINIESSVTKTQQDITKTQQDITKTQQDITETRENLVETQGTLVETQTGLNETQEGLVETQEGLEEANLNIEDLILLMAEILGGEESEEESEEEPINPDESTIPDEPIDPEPEPTEDPVDSGNEFESIEEPIEEPIGESTELSNNSTESIEESVDPIENSEN